MFENDKLYSQTADEVVELFGDAKAQAQLRYRGKYPQYAKIGRKIFLQGRHINEYLEENSRYP